MRERSKSRQMSWMKSSEPAAIMPEVSSASSITTYIERVVIYDPKHIEIEFTFDDLLLKAGEKVSELQQEKGKTVSE